MKFYTILTACAVTAALASAGCKYDKSAAEGLDAAEALDVGTDELAGSTDVETTALDDETAQSGSLADIEDDARFEDVYTRCTDVDFAPVYFGFDSTVIPQAELDKVDAVAQHLLDNPDRVVVVEGHCDERGSNEYNMSLGESRASIIRSYLVQNSITADRIQTRSYGEERPAVQGADEGAWSRNRRGEFAIFRK